MSCFTIIYTALWHCSQSTTRSTITYTLTYRNALFILKVSQYDKSVKELKYDNYLHFENTGNHTYQNVCPNISGVLSKSQTSQ
jgi:hypothetical protein